MMSLYLTFIVGNEYYCIDMASVMKILSTNRIIPIHQHEKYVKGFINFNEKMVPTIDLRARFLKEVGNYNDQTRVIIVKKEKTMIGLIVDKVVEVESISNADINNSISNNHCRKSESILRIGERVIKLTHFNMLLTEKEWIEIEFLFEYSRFYNSQNSQ